MRIVPWNKCQDFTELTPFTIVYTIELTSASVGTMLCDCAWTSREEVFHHWLTHPEEGESANIVSMPLHQYLTRETAEIKGCNPFEAAARLAFRDRWNQHNKQKWEALI